MTPQGISISGLIPLLVAFFGAALGAYFAVLKSKRERLWVDRYEALRSVVHCLEAVRFYFESKHMEVMGVTVLAVKERELISDDLPLALRTIRQNLSTLLLLFKANELESLLGHYQEMRNAIVELNHSAQGNYQDDIENLVNKTQTAIDEAVGIGQKYCI
ncbi:hypothetical protein H8K33_08120 [Undibacterium amnicola]|uniref:LemA family protein n=1 Tax=Undibacterium amnicola TaxID=1834038 RepID=A0ABR6XRD0_9BURK|nr:hypothetical protein [Undibacterium amnicola]MBC3831472.1 hypothetical protein [Undibacterium amnicola]